MEIEENKGYLLAEKLVFFWKGQLLYIGPSAKTQVHEHHAIQIIISLDAPFEVETPGLEKGNYETIAFAPEQPHQCTPNGEGNLLIWFISPESREGKQLLKSVFGGKKVAILPLTETKTFVGEFIAIAGNREKESGLIRGCCANFIANLAKSNELLASIKPIDSRIKQVLEYLELNLEGSLPLKTLANLACLSPTRLVHLFTKEIGIPLRKYILWLRIITAIRAFVKSDTSLTEAALLAGFSDSSHFNHIFKRMFGLSPRSIMTGLPEKGDGKDVYYWF